MMACGCCIERSSRNRGCRSRSASARSACVISGRPSNGTAKAVPYTCLCAVPPTRRVRPAIPARPDVNSLAHISHQTMTTVLDRFLRYVRYDTQSDEASTTYPSTDKQLVLLRDLAAELGRLGLSDAAVDK